MGLPHDNSKWGSAAADSSMVSISERPTPAARCRGAMSELLDDELTLAPNLMSWRMVSTCWQVIPVINGVSPSDVLHSIEAPPVDEMDMFISYLHNVNVRLTIHQYFNYLGISICCS
eukprot:GHVO01056205.1.p2 GENE.GHVO01056205.1~~GHVO01056205.1.p2  ORF type:complete len:117 (+),score=17.16 GHVO01056205.1:3-353(+)